MVLTCQAGPYGSVLAGQNGIVTWFSLIVLGLVKFRTLESGLWGQMGQRGFLRVIMKKQQYNENISSVPHPWIHCVVPSAPRNGFAGAALCQHLQALGHFQCAHSLDIQYNFSFLCQTSWEMVLEDNGPLDLLIYQV